MTLFDVLYPAEYWRKKYAVSIKCLY